MSEYVFSYESKRVWYNSLVETLMEYYRVENSKLTFEVACTDVIYAP